MKNSMLIRCCVDGLLVLWNLRFRLWRASYAFKFLFTSSSTSAASCAEPGVELMQRKTYILQEGKVDKLPVGSILACNALRKDSTGVAESLWKHKLLLITYMTLQSIQRWKKFSLWVHSFESHRKTRIRSFEMTHSLSGINVRCYMSISLDFITMIAV